MATLPYLLATDRRTRLTYVVEPVRRGSAKLRASVMPADRPGLDVVIAWRQVPLAIRRAARAACTS